MSNELNAGGRSASLYSISPQKGVAWCHVCSTSDQIGVGEAGLVSGFEHMRHT